MSLLLHVNFSNIFLAMLILNLNIIFRIEANEFIEPERDLSCVFVARYVMHDSHVQAIFIIKLIILRLSEHNSYTFIKAKLGIISTIKESNFNFMLIYRNANSMPKFTTISLAFIICSFRTTSGSEIS
jgi:hypothetical protein